MALSPRHSMSGDDSMQKYMLLSSQQEVLRRRLSLQLPSASLLTPSSPEFQSISSSPVSSRPSYASSWSPEPLNLPTSSFPIPTQPGMGHRHTIEESRPNDSQKLFDINNQIKATLTDLLNTDSVRSDEKYRAWVQSRLMDAERSIRRERRRRSTGDRDMARSIGEHFDHGYAL